MTIPLQEAVIYGPMESRRFGRSLGINLLPPDKKVCNFKCPYCQYEDPKSEKPFTFPSLARFEAESRGRFEDFKARAAEIDWITVAGNGEPTLHPEFSQAVDVLISLRNELMPGVPIGILSNSSTCHRPEIREVLSRFDGRFMKLDAGSADSFWSVNEPVRGVRWEEMIEGLSLSKDIVLQSLFFTGYFKQNADDRSVDDWIRTVGIIQPRSVQVYSLGRPPQDPRILPVSSRALREIADRLKQRTGVPAEAFE